MGHIYKHTSPSGRSYIGQSVREPEERWRDHVADAKAGRGFAFHRAIFKYGPDAFTHEILHNGIDDLDELNQLEIAAIAEHGTLSPGGYNMTAGGDNGRLCPEAQKRKSRAIKRAWKDPEVRDRISSAISVAACAPENLERRAVNARTMWSKPETREKIMSGIKKAWADPERREKMSEVARNAWADPDVKARRLESIKKAWADPDVKARRLESIRRAMASTAYRDKLSKSVSRRRRAATPNVFADGRLFETVTDAGRAFGVSNVAAHQRCLSKTKRFRFWHTIPNHNDPECDAVEECWALLQFAEANPHHDNAPSWALDALGIARHGSVPATLWAAE